MYLADVVGELLGVGLPEVGVEEEVEVRVDVHVLVLGRLQEALPALPRQVEAVGEPDIAYSRFDQCCGGCQPS